jgi:hypothetical protein
MTLLCLFLGLTVFGLLFVMTSAVGRA